MTEAITTQVVKGGGQTMFLDLRRAKNEALYLTVTALGRNKEGEAERRSVTIFEDQLPEFAQSIRSIMKEVKENGRPQAATEPGAAN